MPWKHGSKSTWILNFFSQGFEFPKVASVRISGHLLSWCKLLLLIVKILIYLHDSKSWGLKPQIFSTDAKNGRASGTSSCAMLHEFPGYFCCCHCSVLYILSWLPRWSDSRGTFSIDKRIQTSMVEDDPWRCISKMPFCDESGRFLVLHSPHSQDSPTAGTKGKAQPCNRHHSPL